MGALKISHLTFKYPHRQPVLKDLNATFLPGTISLITGPSGIGKSTLLKLTARLLSKPDAGRIVYGSIPLTRIPDRQLSSYVAMMFQDPSRQFAMRTVKHELIFTLENRCVPVKRIVPTVKRVLSDNHLTAFKDQKLNTLSGGEKQRVALAIITALDSKVILLDEPFTNVDWQSRDRIMRRLVQLKQRGKIIVIVDHDLRGYSKITNQLLVMTNGRLKPAKFSQFTSQFDDLNHQWKLPRLNSRPVYQLKGFATGYRIPLIKAANFNFYRHHATLITGPNGSGKSTLLKALLKLIQYQGTVTCNGRSLTKFKPKRYYQYVNLVFQEPTDQFLELTVRQELELSLKNRANPQRAEAPLKRWLKFTGLDQHLDQIVYSLSGGQQRSLQLIEALLSPAKIMLMDEPFQSLDHRLINFFKHHLKRAVVQQRRTLIVISHQVASVADLFDHHVELKNSQLRYLRGLYR